MSNPAIQPLPQLMVAPNGARRTKADHPAIPITLEEIVADARACHEAGADGLHLHLRDARGGHILDIGLYREALKELNQQIPGLTVQITTEAVGQYSPAEQRAIALNTGARLVSMSIRENAGDASWNDEIALEAAHFYRLCAEQGIAIQHILYDPSDFELLHRVLPSSLFQSPDLQLLFVLGKYDHHPEHADDGVYAKQYNSTPAMMAPYIYQIAQFDITPDWMACAFGPGETKSLEAAKKHGGKLRVGFENSIWNADGSVAESNAGRVQAIAKQHQPNTSA